MLEVLIFIFSGWIWSIFWWADHCDKLNREWADLCRKQRRELLAAFEADFERLRTGTGIDSEGEEWKGLRN